MPLLKHARKKLRQDKRRTLANKKVKNLYKSLVKDAKEKPTADSVSAAYSSVDKAVKHHIIHANKAARIKSSLAKLAPTSAAKTTTLAKGQSSSGRKKAAPAKTVKKATVKKTTKKASPKTTKKK